MLSDAQKPIVDPSYREVNIQNGSLDIKQIDGIYVVTQPGGNPVKNGNTVSTDVLMSVMSDASVEVSKKCSFQSLVNEFGQIVSNVETGCVAASPFVKPVKIAAFDEAAKGMCSAYTLALAIGGSITPDYYNASQRTELLGTMRASVADLRR